MSMHAAAMIRQQHRLDGPLRQRRVLREEGVGGAGRHLARRAQPLRQLELFNVNLGS